MHQDQKLKSEDRLPDDLNGSNKEKLWSRPFILVSLTALFTYLASLMINNNLSLFINSLGESATFSGSLLLVYTVAAIISRLINGYLLDHKNRLFIMIAGCLIFSIAAISYGVFPYFYIFPVISFILGVGFATASTTLAVSVVDVLPRAKMGEGLGYYSLTWAFASTIGPSIGLHLIFDNDFTYMFLISAIFIMIAGVLYSNQCLSRVHKTKNNSEDKQIGSSIRKKISLWDFIEKKALLPSILQAIVYMASCSVFVFITLFAKTRGIDEVGLFLIIVAVSMILSRMFVGRIVDQKGPLYVVVPALLLSMTAYLLLAFADSVTVFLIAGSLFGFSAGATSPAFNSEAVRYVSPKRIGAASATYLFSTDLGFGIGAVLGGMLIDHLGFRYLYVAAMICALFSMILSIIVLRKNKTAGLTEANISE